MFRILVPCVLLFALLSATSGVARAQPSFGGDDVFVRALGGWDGRDNVDVASDGTLFAAFAQDTAPVGIEILRSVDGGVNWQVFGRLDPPAGVLYKWVRLVVAEGATDRLYLVYQRDPESTLPSIEVAWTPLGATAGAWTVTTAISGSGRAPSIPTMITDAEFFGDYYLYVAAAEERFPGAQVWFTRSTDGGATWDAPYVIGPARPGNGNVGTPELAFGAGSRLFAAWPYTDDQFVNACDGFQLVSATGFADSGAGSWSPAQTFAAAVHGDVQQWVDVLVASPVDQTVVVMGPRGDSAAPGVATRGLFLYVSRDGGSTWTREGVDRFTGHYAGDLEYDATRGTWGMVYALPSSSIADYYLTEASDPAGPWSPGVRFDDQPHANLAGLRQLFRDPSRGGRWGITMTDFVGDFALWFDADWLTDPGYPNLDPGFPVDLDAAPASPPALVDLDGAPGLEIVFSDIAHRIQVFHADGSRAAGWPVQALAMSSPARQVAVGDLTGSGEQVVVFGDSDSQVVAYDAQGEIVDGFPVNLGFFDDTFVTVAPVLAPHPRSIVAAGEGSVFVINWRGAIQKAWEGKTPFDIDLPVSVGDVDANGQADILVPNGSVLTRIDVDNDEPVWDLDLGPATISAPVTLVDLDRNGERLILVPMSNGEVHCVDPDANLRWTYTTGDPLPVGRIAAAQFLGTTDPDLAFTVGDEVHLVLADGSTTTSYPQRSTLGAGGDLSDPVLDRIHWSSSDIVTTSTAGQAWAFVNIAGVADGWPRTLPGPSSLGPATGDVDGDGDNEVVVLTDAQLSVYDVNLAPEPQGYRRWPMAGHDAGRSNCADCETEVVTSVDDVAPPSRLVFPAPAPNPTRGSSVFAFSLPVNAGVQLDVYDLRGRRVRSLVRRDLAPGRHEVHFDARDDRGEALASGTYVARLRVRGPGIDEDVSRKLGVSR